MYCTMLNYLPTTLKKKLNSDRVLTKKHKRHLQVIMILIALMYMTLVVYHNVYGLPNNRMQVIENLAGIHMNKRKGSCAFWTNQDACVWGEELEDDYIRKRQPAGAAVDCSLTLYSTFNSKPLSFAIFHKCISPFTDIIIIFIIIYLDLDDCGYFRCRSSFPLSSYYG